MKHLLNFCSLCISICNVFIFLNYVLCLFSGLVAERVSLRYFLALGMIFSGIACYLLGIAKTYNIHSLLYFILVLVIVLLLLFLFLIFLYIFIFFRDLHNIKTHEELVCCKLLLFLKTIKILVI